MPRSAGQASPLTDTVHFTDIWHLAGQPAFRHFKQHDRLRLVDFQEDGRVNVDADQDQSRIVGRAMARIAFVRKPHLPVRRIQLNHFLDRATWLLLAPKVRFWELAGTISGTVHREQRQRNRPSTVKTRSGAPTESAARRELPCARARTEC